MKHYLLSFIIAIVCVLVVACSDKEQQIIDPQITEAPQINAPTAFEGPLVVSNSPSATQFLKNGIYYHTVANANSYDDVAVVADSESSLNGSSRTNTQETDVDEADRIEYYNDKFYVATYPDWYDQTTSSSIRMLDKKSDGTLNLTNTIELPEGENVRGMYLNTPLADELAVITSNHQYYPVTSIIGDVQCAYYCTDSSVSVYFTNVSSTQNAQIDTTISIEGSLISSRRIDQSLYIVSAFNPSVSNLEYGAETEADKLSNYLKVLDIRDSELIPSVLVNGVEQSLYSLDECVIPQQATQNDGFSTVVQVLKIDLANDYQIEALCAVTHVDFIYSSSDALYLAATLNNSTVLHKADFTTFQLVATGSVPGTTGWVNPHFRLSEYQGTLRILSSDYQTNPQEPFHRMYALEQQGNDLNIIGQVPDMEATQGLGKPREDVYAVRYLGEKAYVVTFERIDPLYVIDLSTPSSLQVLGELEIPGFSSYLHPIGDDYLLGVGQNIEVGTLPNNDDTTIDILPLVDEMKLSLFDVKDPQNPKEISALRFASTYTPVEYDYRALSSLVNTNYARFAMPIETWSNTAVTNNRYYQNKLLVLDVDLSENEPSLVLSDELYVIPDEDTPYVYAWEDRSVLINDDVYYLHGNYIWYRSAADNQLNGPF